MPEAGDAALADERYSGMVRARTDAFEAEQRDPLIKAIHESGVAYEDVEKYLHALHAPSSLRQRLPGYSVLARCAPGSPGKYYSLRGNPERACSFCYADAS